MIKIKQIENLNETIQQAEENAKQYSRENFEPTISTKNTAFNKDFGTTSGTVAEGNHTHTFESLQSLPNTLAGYGIQDAATKDELNEIKEEIRFTVVENDIDDIMNFIKGTNYRLYKK